LKVKPQISATGPANEGPSEARSLAGLVEEVAARDPGHAAIIHFGETIPYGELVARTQEVAKALLALGVRRGDRIAALMGNQPEWVVLCLASSKIGATFVPLNTWYKRNELDWTLRHCGISVLVATSRFLNQDFGAVLRDLVPELGQADSARLVSRSFPALRTIVMLDGSMDGTLSWQQFLRHASSRSDSALREASDPVGESDTAFILYTSGSTAEPKGVLLANRGVVRNGHWMAKRRAVNRSDRVWLGSPLFYGLGATNALPVTFSQGATLVLQGSFEAGAAIRAIADSEATVYYGTGNMTRAILDHPDYKQSRVGSLQKGNAGTMAEYKRMTLVEMGISRACPAYGLTESYGNATVGDADDSLEDKLRTNGRPLPETELVIVDPETRQPLPQGQTGLVLLRGHTTSGYFENAVETSRALLGGGWFDTGDLGCLDGEGRFIFSARLKEVIKSGGINVSPMEVEQLLVQHPAVRDAHVVGVADPVKGERIVAFVDVTGDVDAVEIQAFVKERAASFKVPHHVLFRNESQLPRLASGKVSKPRLVEEAQRELGR
jgi:fatty-acyl-CoA synthase